MLPPAPIYPESKPRRGRNPMGVRVGGPRTPKCHPEWRVRPWLAREVGRTAVLAVHRVIPRAVTRAMNDTLDASGQGSVRSSPRDIVHDTRSPCLTAGGTLSYPGQRTTRADRGPSSGCSDPP